MESYFGEVIYKYTMKQAIEDGILMQNPCKTFEECDALTTNLWDYINGRIERMVLTTPLELLERLMAQAKRIYDNNEFIGDNDRNFFAIKGNNFVKDVWLVRNENDKLTCMLVEDY